MTQLHRYLTRIQNTILSRREVEFETLEILNFYDDSQLYIVEKLIAEWLFERSKDIRRSLIQGSSIEERLVGLEPEQVLGRYRPEQIIGAYKPEERRILLEALQCSLEGDEASDETTSS